MILPGRLLVLGFCFVLLSAGFSQTTNDLPFEWSGQYGLRSINGNLLWHRDWTSGPILFDRLVAIYPLRLGPAVADRFAVHSMGNFPQFSPPPDSLPIISRFNYQRGDFNFDQLEVEARFSEPGSQVNLMGFKRSYAGQIAEFILPSGVEVPMQQSYRFDYRSNAQKNGQFELSLLRLLSNSGLPDSSVRGYYNDQITAGGILLQKPFGSGILDLHASQLHYKQNSGKPSNDTTYSQKLVRSFLSSRYRRPLESNAELLLFFAVNQQAAPSILRTWYTVLTGYENQLLKAAAGVSIIDLAVSPHLRIDLIPSLAGLNVNMHIAYYKRRVPRVFLSEQLDKSTQWFNGCFTVIKSSDNFDITLETGIIQSPDYHYLKEVAGTDNFITQRSSAYLWHGMTQLDWQITDEWLLECNYRHTGYDQVTLSDGIRDRINLGIEGKLKFILKDRLDLYARLDIQGWLNSDPAFGFDPYRTVPYSVIADAEPINNHWPISFQLRAVITTVTITYQMENLAYELSPLLARINSSLSPDSQKITGNRFFPAMGSFIRFGIEWNFEK